MAEFFPDNNEDHETSKEESFDKAQRIKENLMKLEKSVIDEVDEAAQAARGAIQAMGFGVNPIPQTDDEEDE